MESNCPHLTAANLTKDLQGKLIYKEECTRCFDTTRHPAGIDLCLKCFNGGCSADSNHSRLHFNHTDHPIVLNIKQIKKEKPEGQEPAQVTKLAIGKPGGIDGDQEEYETEVTLKCLACGGKTLNGQQPLTQGLIDSVLIAQSAYFSQTLQEWELKLQPCEHTLTLDQSTAHKIASKSLAHCGECDLSANLWLCMSCGHLGCGRKNYDGTGGNGHAVAHFEQTKHPMVCKLGTITPEGTASVYCYACDDDIQDNNLQDHMAILGIDIATQKKTEKTVQEMDLEMNLNLTLSKIIEEGKQLTPLFGPGLTGLENLGNSCYMNSVLQVLCSFPEFRDRYLPEAQIHLETCTKFAPECLMCQVSKLFEGLYSGRYSEARPAKKVSYEGQSEEEKNRVELVQDGVKPHMFKTLVGKDHPEFKTNKQQDTQEYLSHLLEKLQRMEKASGNNNYPGNVFDFDLETRIQCQECGGVKYTTTKAQQLVLMLPKTEGVEKGDQVDLEACIQKYFTPELVPDFACPQCQKRTACLKSQHFNTYPKVLAITLFRFSLDNWVPKKLEVELQVPLDSAIDFERFRGNQGQPKPGEQLLPEGGASSGGDVVSEPDLNGELLNQIIGMGVPENAAKHALHITGNNNADIAVMWYFDNMDNPVLNEPLTVKKQGAASAASTGPVIPQDLVDNLVAMLGFPEKKVRKALKNTDCNTERAADWLFSHMDDPESDHEMTEVNESDMAGANPYQDSKPGFYDLTSFITHLGAGVHAGHYVCHLRQVDDSWVYFNDAKVAQTSEPPIGKGYMYFFRKRD